MTLRFSKAIDADSIVPLAFFVASFGVAEAGQNVERLVPYSGTELTGSTFLCTSDQVAAGGYWYDATRDTVEEGASIHKETTVTTWRITLTEGSAQVIRFSGASQTIENPEIFSREITPAGGLLFVSQRLSGFSPQVITIDLTNSSFVYSTQHVDPVLFRYNRANVFYGTCRPYL